MKKSGKINKLILLIIDIVLINLSFIIAFLFRFDSSMLQERINSFKEYAIIITIIYLLCFYVFKLYDSLWAHAGTDEFLLGIGGCIIGNLLTIALCSITGFGISISVFILAGVFSTVLVVGSRMSVKIFRRIISIAGKYEISSFKRVMVVGAGCAGELIIREMKLHREMGYNPVAIIDDSSDKLGARIGGVRVIGDRYQIEKYAKELNIDIILIAIPSIGNEDRREIIDICKRTSCKLKIMPGIYELINNRVSIKRIRDVEVQDLLGRESIELDMEGISQYLEGRNILVTGGGGSIGSELCRQIARFEPKALAILDAYENNAYDLQNELKSKYPELNLKVIIASVRDRYRLERIFSEFHPDVVFHAAAHKHVPLMEDNPSEAVKNNIFGTLNTAECADKFGVKRFVLISTDKAVNPINVMGATKRVCEMIIQSINKRSETEFVAVRFGNVLDSNGSVIPLFKKQIENGGPVTVTHRDIVRYFMTIPEASQLVLQAGAYAKGGEIFVLDMGKPVRIYDLAEELIKLLGFEPGRDIEIKITGLRPGEKLYEELFVGEECLSKTRHEKIFIEHPVDENFEELKMRLEDLRLVIMKEDRSEIIQKLREIVQNFAGPGEKPEGQAEMGGCEFTGVEEDNCN